MNSEVTEWGDYRPGHFKARHNNRRRRVAEFTFGLSELESSQGDAASRPLGILNNDLEAIQRRLKRVRSADPEAEAALDGIISRAREYLRAEQRRLELPVLPHDEQERFNNVGETTLEVRDELDARYARIRYIEGNDARTLTRETLLAIRHNRLLVGAFKRFAQQGCPAQDQARLGLDVEASLAAYESLVARLDAFLTQHEPRPEPAVAQRERLTVEVRAAYGRVRATDTLCPPPAEFDPLGSLLHQVQLLDDALHRPEGHDDAFYDEIRMRLAEVHRWEDEFVSPANEQLAYMASIDVAPEDFQDRQSIRTSEALENWAGLRRIQRQLWGQPGQMKNLERVRHCLFHIKGSINDIQIMQGGPTGRSTEPLAAREIMRHRLSALSLLEEFDQVDVKRDFEQRQVDRAKYLTFVLSALERAHSSWRAQGVAAKLYPFTAAPQPSSEAKILAQYSEGIALASIVSAITEDTKGDQHIDTAIAKWDVNCAHVLTTNSYAREAGVSFSL